MFYGRINKLTIFNNREGFLGLFNRAEIRIFSYATEQISPLTLADLSDLPDDSARRQKLLEAVLSGAGEFAQSYSLSVDRVKDNQTLTFDEAGMVVYQSDRIPDQLSLQLWVIESDEEVRQFALDADQVMESEAFKGLVAAVGAALAVTNPVLTAAVGVGGVVVNLLRRKLKANKDDLVGYWQATLNREEHYPHGLRDRQEVPDSTGNLRIDYTLFGFEKTAEGGEL
jgi:hypothetical protein